MSATMRAVDIKGGKGHADALFINAETPNPQPAAGQVLVKVKAFGLNRMDLLQREGQYPVPPQTPRTLGVEFSGTMAAVGAPDGGRDHAAFQPGDEVLGLAYGGAYAEYIAVSTKTLLHRPPHLSVEQAAGVPETWMTATQALHFVLGIQKGQSVVWHAGASGVFNAGIQLAKAAGASAVYATAGSDEKCAFITTELGATAAINYNKTDNWSADMVTLTNGRGVDLIVDFIGASYWKQNLDALALDGRMVVLGLMSGTKLDGIDMAPILSKRLRIEGSTLRSRDLDYQGKLRHQLEQYMPQLESGELKVYTHTVLPFDDIVKAHNLMETNKTMGKIICKIAE